MNPSDPHCLLQLCTVTQQRGKGTCQREHLQVILQPEDGWGCEAEQAASPVYCCSPKANLIPPQESTTFQQHGGPQSSVPEASLKYNTKKNRTWVMSSRLVQRLSRHPCSPLHCSSFPFWLPKHLLPKPVQQAWGGTHPTSLLPVISVDLLPQQRSLCCSNPQGHQEPAWGWKVLWHSLLTASTNQL